MQCEKCGRGGFTDEQMWIETTRKIVVGPCCGPVTQPRPRPEFGLELSEKNGLAIEFRYGGFTARYTKPAHEVRSWFTDSNGNQMTSPGGTTGNDGPDPRSAWPTTPPTTVQ